MAKDKDIKKEVVRKKAPVAPKQSKESHCCDSKVDLKGKCAVKKVSKKTIEHPLKVTQLKSSIGKQGDQKRTLIGLGLNKIDRVVLLEDTPSIRGMIKKVGHLVKFEKL